MSSARSIEWSLAVIVIISLFSSYRLNESLPLYFDMAFCRPIWCTVYFSVPSKRNPVFSSNITSPIGELTSIMVSFSKSPEISFSSFVVFPLKLNSLNFFSGVISMSKATSSSMSISQMCAATGRLSPYRILR